MAKTSGSLVELCGRVQEWRVQSGGGPGRRIPEALWEHAVGVARVEGVSATARGTGLNHDRLRQRSREQDKAGSARVSGSVELGVARASARGQVRAAALARSCGIKPETARSETSLGAGFVALQVATRRQGRPTTIELYGRAGERMRVEVEGELDLSGLVQAFQKGLQS